MRTSYKVIAAAIVASAAQMAHADFKPYGAIQGTYLNTDNDRHTGDGGGATLIFGFMANDYLAPEINVFGIATDRKHSKASDGTWGGGIDLALDRKSTRLNSVTNAHLVCRLLLEKKKHATQDNTTT